MKYLTLGALIYGGLWIINILYGNLFFITLQSLLGAGLFIALAVYLNTLDDENLTSHTRLNLEIERLQKEIAALKEK